MPKPKQQNIYFFETDSSCSKKVAKSFPKAISNPKPLTTKNVKDYPNAEVVCIMIDSYLSEKVLKKLPNLKLIVTRTVGYDHIDLSYAKDHKIAVCNVPDYGSHVIAEHVFALLLASVRNILEGESRTGKHNFSWRGLKGMALKGKTLGVIGTGKIGAHVCRIASKGFQMNVIAFDTFPNKKLEKELGFKYVKSLNEIWKKSDVITLHVPLFPQTEHMINESSIAKMKDGVVLINTARGGLIDTKALIKGIKKGKFSDVALDVIEHESNIKEDKQILSLPGVIITPHIAFYADDSIDKMYSEAIRSINTFLKGGTVVNLIKGI